ncbi:hypothetical protein [Algoriphagus mannitolivorans]|uniref:hypothetical protein n=1 Tax=Algoriphagus mannitolivorans TaxID=226504 RepID=UPI001B7FBEEF|nr:hypothetical protein [Algoriphagus mannitolivorans]
MEKKFCLQCSKELHGRIDKKFCDDYCRNTYNNHQNATHNNLIRNINYVLRKNRNILESKIPSGEDMGKISRNRLIQEGFSFTYFTHIYQNKKGNLYHFCYDFGYLELENDWILVVKVKGNQG